MDSKVRLSIRLTFLASFMTAIPAFASSAEHHHVASISDLFYPVINFIIYLAILIAAFKKPLTNAIKARREGIASFVSAASSKQADAEQLLKSAKAKIASVKAEAETIISRGIEDAKREAAALKIAAEKKAQRIVDQAKSTAQSERKAMEESVRRELAELVINRASEKLARELNESSDRELRKRAVDGIGALRN